MPSHLLSQRTYGHMDFSTLIVIKSIAAAAAGCEDECAGEEPI